MEHINISITAEELLILHRALRTHSEEVSWESPDPEEPWKLEEYQEEVEALRLRLQSLRR